MQVLEITASGRETDSVSRRLTGELVAALEDRYGSVDVTRRDVAVGVPFLDEDWIEATFTPEEQRTRPQRSVLAYSDRLVEEIERADVLVIGTPVYNFGIPASLKAWIDMIARAQRTFRYTVEGPVGLLRGKRAYLVVASGGVEIGGPVDFAVPYLKHVLGFVGIDDVEVVAADRLTARADDALDEARARIAELVHASPDLTATAMHAHG